MTQEIKIPVKKITRVVCAGAVSFIYPAEYNKKRTTK